MFYSWDSQTSHVENGNHKWIIASTPRNGVGIDSARGGLTVATNQDIAQVHQKWEFENISTLCILFSNFLIGLPCFFGNQKLLIIVKSFEPPNGRRILQVCPWGMNLGRSWGCDYASWPPGRYTKRCVGSLTNLDQQNVVRLGKGWTALGHDMHQTWVSL